MSLLPVALFLGLVASSPASATTASAVAAAWDHTCALTDSGGVRCWGLNDSGELGDGTLAIRKKPVDVVGLTGGVRAISAGGDETCALTNAGGVKCWGYNGDGALGDGTTTDRHTPVDVEGLSSDVAAISVGGDHTCALTTAGGVQCWGFNEEGELGNGTTDDSAVPTDVAGLTSGVAQITAGDSHTCALTTDGGVKCWGLNDSGQVGDGTSADRKTPRDVTGLTSGVMAVSAGGDHTCALTTAGGVKCWGLNDAGQVGDGTTTDRNNPKNVTGLTSGVGAISVGGDGSCAVTTAGGAKCWGDNELGAIGDGTGTDRLTPVDVTGFTAGIGAIAAGASHTCALTIGGGVKCWGDNSGGQLGDGTTTLRRTPIGVSGLGGTSTTPRITKLKPAKGSVGSTVKIIGKNLAGATGVAFGGTPATFTVTSATKIVADVPDGAVSAKVVVSTPSGSAQSAKTFHVI